MQQTQCGGNPILGVTDSLVRVKGRLEKLYHRVERAADRLGANAGAVTSHAIVVEAT